MKNYSANSSSFISKGVLPPSTALYSVALVCVVLYRFRIALDG